MHNQHLVLWRRRITSWLPLLLILVGVTLLYHFRSHLHFGSGSAEQPNARQLLMEDHFSPREDLARLDLYRLEHARLSLDVAMYSFTDRALADAIIKLAHDGVEVRIYRDREQYDSEQRAAAQHHDRSTTDMFRGEDNIHIRVKGNGRRDLMHLKAYLIDGSLLRDGSANWSVAGERYQDNNARYTDDPLEIRYFTDAFEQMWARSDNEIVQ
jgi:phosphatidylserine/phosphatidylglycerophosphate/cardiolipin synthase-like enzyme